MWNTVVSVKPEWSGARWDFWIMFLKARHSSYLIRRPRVLYVLAAMLIWGLTLPTTLIGISTSTFIWQLNSIIWDWHLSPFFDFRNVLISSYAAGRRLRISSPTVQFRPRLYVFPMSIAKLSRNTYRSLMPNYHGSFSIFLIEHLGLPVWEFTQPWECCKLILAWWYCTYQTSRLSPSDSCTMLFLFFLMPRFIYRSCIAFIYHSCIAFTYHSCVALIHCSCVALVHRSCVVLILRSCVALTLRSCISHAA